MRTERLALILSWLLVPPASFACSKHNEVNVGDMSCVEGMCHDDASPICGWRVQQDPTGAEMCEVSAGSYVMGCSGSEPGCASASQPRVEVDLTAGFFIDRTEVTNAAYKGYLDANPNSSVPSCSDGDSVWGADRRTIDPAWDEHPVVCVTAVAAQKFCEWAGKRLPTEAEWEAAARGPGGDRYPWGAGFDTDAAQCHHDWSSYDPGSQCANTYPANTCPDAKPIIACLQTAPVQIEGEPTLESGRSPSGALHMAGNAAEWVGEAWTSDHKGCSGGCTDPSKAPSATGTWVVKGGSWASDADSIAGWARQSASATTRDSKTGFRCAR